MFEANEITLTFIKCHFVYFNIQILKYHVSKLNLNIMKKKIKIIRNMQFSRNLRKLKIKIKFVDYYWFLMNHYVKIIKFLIKLKTRDFFKVFFKKRQRKNHFLKICLKQHNQNSNWNIDIIQNQFLIRNNEFSTNFECFAIWKKFKIFFVTLLF